MTTPIDKFLQKCKEIRDAATPSPWFANNKGGIFQEVREEYDNDGGMIGFSFSGVIAALSPFDVDNKNYIVLIANSDARKDEMIRIAVDELVFIKNSARYLEKTNDELLQIMETQSGGDALQAWVQWRCRRALEAIDKLASQEDPHPGRRDSCI